MRTTAGETFKALATPMLPKYPPVIAKVNCGYVIFYKPQLLPDQQKRAPISPYCIYAEMTITTLLILVKMVASLGSRVYGIDKLLYEPNYIFSEDFFNRWPYLISQTTIIYAGASDVFMNVVTRGSATRKLMQQLFGTSTKVKKNIFFNTGGRAFVKYSVVACGIASAITGSLSSFLGAVTLARFATDDFDLLIGIGFSVAIANFVSNISYRVKKSVRNLERLLNGELEYTLEKIGRCIIGTMATMGLYYFGTSESIRLLLRLFDVYHGNPDSQEGLIDEYEDWINGITDMSLLPSIVSYFFSQCAEILTPPRRIVDEHFSVPINQLRRKISALKRNTPYHQEVTCTQRDYWLPKLFSLFGVTLIPFFIFGEMLGNALTTFNGDNGLIIHLFIRNNDNQFNQNEMLGIGLSSTFLVLVSSLIYWDFNIIPWREKSNGLWVDSELKAMQHAGLYQPKEKDAYENLQDLLTDQDQMLATSDELKINDEEEGGLEIYVERGNKHSGGSVPASSFWGSIFQWRPWSTPKQEVGYSAIPQQAAP